MRKEIVSFRIDRRLKNDIDQLCREFGISRTYFIFEAVKALLIKTHKMNGRVIF